jgi:pimeloyl-ACP methyl ester carboxylesterase
VSGGLGDRLSGRVTVLGVPVWYAEHGRGDPLVALHPGGVDSRAWQPNLPVLSRRFRVFTPDRSGHGRTPDTDGPFSYGGMAEETIAFIEELQLGPVHLVGASDGATVALIVALQRPDLVRKFAFVAGVFDRRGWHPSAVADVPPPAWFVDAYAEVSPDGREHFPVVAAKLQRMHQEEPALRTSDLREVRCRTLIMVGDDDEVQLEHAVEMYRALPDAELAVVPGTSHGLLVEKPDLCGQMIVDFLAHDPVPTLAPIRRGGAAVEPGGSGE